MTAQDKWSRWLNEERWGEQHGLLEAALNGVRDRILALADLQAGERVLDLGAGTGLLGLEAARRVGREGDVVFVDVSRDSLESAGKQASVGCERLAVADALYCPVRDGCADAVVARSVLIYMPDRLAAAREIARVLRLRGRFVAYEPINRRMERIIDMTGFEDVELTCASTLDTNPLTNFDEHDLVRAFREAGFSSVDIEVGESRFPIRGKEWAHGFKHGAPAGYSGYDTLLAGGMTAERADEFVAAGEQRIGADWKVWSCPHVYLTAVR